MMLVGTGMSITYGYLYWRIGLRRWVEQFSIVLQHRKNLIMSVSREVSYIPAQGDFVPVGREVLYHVPAQGDSDCAAVGRAVSIVSQHGRPVWPD